MKAKLHAARREHAGREAMLARIIFAVLAATSGFSDAPEAGCDGYVTFGSGQPGTPTVYVTERFAIFEETNGILGFQRACAGEASDAPDRLVA